MILIQDTCVLYHSISHLSKISSIKQLTASDSYPKSDLYSRKNQCSTIEIVTKNDVVVGLLSIETPWISISNLTPLLVFGALLFIMWIDLKWYPMY